MQQSMRIHDCAFMADPHAALIIAPNWIGDCLMAQPLLNLLRQQGQSLTVLAPPWVAPLFHLMPQVNHVIEAPLHHGRLQLGLRWQLAQQCRGQFQTAYILPNSFKSALIPWLARIPQRIGYLGEQRKIMLNQIHSLTSNPNHAAHRAEMTQRYAALAFLPGATIPPLQPPTLTIAQDQISQTLDYFQLDATQPLLAFCPGAEYGPAKRWPTTYFAGLAKLIRMHYPKSQIILLGSKKDQDVATEIANLSSTQLLNLSGQTSLLQACALIAGCHAVVSNDSGLMHIAAAFNRPLVALFGSSDPRHTPPHSTAARVEWLHIECSPCFQRVCPLGHFRCMNELTPQHVWETLSKLID